MDQQGFTAGTGGLHEKVTRAVNGVTPNTAAGAISARDARVLANDVVGMARPVSKDADGDKKIERMEKLQSRADKVWFGNCALHLGVFCGKQKWSFLRALGRSNPET